MLKGFDDSRYSKILVRKDYEDGNYPSNIFSNPKSDCGGMVFSNGIYQPMDLKIEALSPDTGIYENMSKYYQEDKITNEKFESQLKSPHVRLSLDGSTIWKDWERQLDGLQRGKTFSLVIHDKGLENIHGAVETISKTLQTLHPIGRRLAFKYPINIFTDKQFADWGQFRKLKTMSNMILHKLFDDKLFLGAIESIENGGMECEYLLTKEMCTNENLTKIYKQVVFLREHRSRILLNTAEGNLVSPEIKSTLRLISEYSAYCYKSSRDISLYTYAKSSSGWLKIDLINLFNYLRENNYPLFKLFYECLSVVFNGENFESRWIWNGNGGTII